MSNWNDKPQVQFGNAGEEIMLLYARKRGLHDVLNKGERPTAVDFIFADKDGNIVEIAEVKTRKAAFGLYEGAVPAYAISQEQFTRNYEPILNYVNESGTVPFNLYIVDADEGVIYCEEFATHEFVYSGTYDKDGYRYDFPAVETTTFNDKKIQLRYYAQGNFGEPVFDFKKTSLHEKLQSLAEEVTIDKIDDSPVEQCDNFISAEDVISFVKSYTTKPHDDELEFGGWSCSLNSRYLGYYFTKNAVFVPLPHLKKFGVRLTTVKKKERSRFDRWKGEFLDCAKLDDILSRQSDPWSLLKWWRDDERQHFEKLCKARKFLLDHYQLHMPDDWVRLNVTGWNFDMRQKPRWFIRETIDALRELFSTRHEYFICKAVVARLNEICDERRTFIKSEEISVRGKAEIIQTITDPNGTSIDLFSADGRIFINAVQLGDAVGYKRGSALSSNDFLRAVASVARFYKIRRSDKNKVAKFIAVEDVAKVLQRFMLLTYQRSRFEVATELLSFWESVNTWTR
ncbi:MAG: hypothetical protein IJ774_07835 [Selenomonadaceae bacterium]|nr:hypothetical protein [Selenomonadaceae bacterium]